MDLKKIGNFIAELRKENRLTQEQLGEKLGVTNKTISRWETGCYMPPADALMAMSELFSVSVNEILSGQRLKDEEFKEAAEENLKQIIKTSSFSLQEKIKSFKKKWLKEHIAFMVFMGIIIIAVFVTGLLTDHPVLLAIAPVLFLIAHGIRYNSMMAYVEENVYDK